MALSLDPMTSAATPPPQPLSIEPQSLEHCDPVRFPWPSWQTCLARVVTFGGAIALTLYAGREMYLIISGSDATRLQWCLLVLFVITFFWIALAAAGAVAGILFGGVRMKSSNNSVPQQKTVLLMPVYNEDPARSFAALYAMSQSLIERGMQQHFEVFILSDTRKPDIWMREVEAFRCLRQSLQQGMPIWYRRRYHNTARKAGNISEFISRWGARYDYMLVLDADSLIDADTLVRLSCEMDQHPNCGILQTLPRLYGGRSLFARLQQFASMLYGPVVARAITAWQGDDGNYWGHNAIIRTRAFARCAGLPEMPGPRPFGGSILSHDFVEAALIRRAGWSVRMIPSLPGSWEEPPPSLLDTAARDRRWAQGNIQHLGVLKRSRGLRWPSRVHMLSGVMSYVASPIWFAMILMGLVISAQIGSSEVDYFTEEFQLFPNWPVFDSERMLQLFFFTLGVLLLPKVIGLVGGLIRPVVLRASNPLSLMASALVELFFSVLYAPIFMLLQTQQLFEILRGRDSGWSAQQRDCAEIPWPVLSDKHSLHMIAGVAMTAVLVWLDTPLLYWMLPTVIGLVLAIPLSALSGAVWPARLLRHLHILRIPEEAVTPMPVQLKQAFIERHGEQINACSVSALFADELACKQHFHFCDSPPGRERGKPDLDFLSAKEKLLDAHHREEALDWLNDDEMLVVLSEPGLFDQLDSLPVTDDPITGQQSGEKN